VRVLMLGLWPYGGPISDGVATSTVNQVKAIGKSREPEFYFVSFDHSKSFDQPEAVLSEGFATIVLLRLRSLDYVLPFLPLIQLHREVKKINPDIIHVKGVNISSYLLETLFFAKSKKKVAAFGSCRTKELVASGYVKRRSLRHLVLRWLEKETVRRCDLIIAVTSALATQISRLGASAKNKTVVIPNGVDTDVFNPSTSGEWARNQLEIPTTDFVIFHAKAFEVYNGQAYLIEAVRELANRIPDAKLVLAGDGPQLPGLKDLCGELGLSDRILFPGQIPHSQIPSHMAAADVVVVPSIRTGTSEEGSSNLLLEAMAMQKTVIATDVGGNRDTITHGENGILVPDRDSHAIAEAIVTMYTDRVLARRISRNARAYVERQRTWSEIAKRILTAYEQLTAQP
jgi:glycogen(starch) synthase